MGIPKFFRLISERWPLISQEITVAEEIEYDNLYLDMNSILHNCTHSNDGEISRLTDEQMFGAIFAYIDYLFNLIKPKKTFYMAIDGVAPRAKMNQQRARRFRSAVEAEELMKKAIQSGEPIPKGEAFDTNAITPGTEFMAKVTENLKFYINHKVSNDKQWQDIEIILSGHEVPGEGEHKIMEYIRVQKAQPDYNPNTRHCVYGLDADLIVLGLVAHEPHFSLLREEVTFGSNKKSSSDLTNQKFFLLHISLVRNYLQKEFESLSDEISFTYDFERVLDDFILILYVIGNDFLPNLPDLHLNRGAFPLLLHTFKEAMRRTDGYLNEGGKINLKRLGIWLDILSVFELENFEEGDVDVEWFNKQLDNVSRKGDRRRQRQGKELLIKQQKKLVGSIANWLLKVYHEQWDIKKFLSDEGNVPQLQLPTEFFQSELNLEFIKKVALDLCLLIVHSKSADTYHIKLDVDGINPNESEEEFNQRLIEIKQCLRKYQSSVIVENEETLRSTEEIYNEKFTNWKGKYYEEKLGFSIDDEVEMKKITENYIEGLQWVLTYYYHGNCSWPWYYKYHYAPRISDLSKRLSVKFDFDLGKPFTPFEQLMSVLPERSKELIPICYRHLMTDEDSPIKDFYPDNCAIDKNGKTASWEAVVLLAFVDESRLKAAMAPLNSKLTLEERKRNSFGHNLIFNYNPQVSTLIKSPLPSAFPDFVSHATEVEYLLPSMEGKEFIIGLLPNVRTGIDLLAGFPTLNTIPNTARLQNYQIVVFQQPTKSESMILTLENEFESVTPEQFAKMYCDKIIYANWPYLREYKVVAVVDSLMKYEMAKSGNHLIKSPLEDFERYDYDKQVNDINYTMHKKQGLRFANRDYDDEILADNLDDKIDKIREPIDGLVYAKRVIGVTPNRDGKMTKVLSENVEVFPIQLIVPTVKSTDPRFEETDPLPIDQEFPVGSSVVFLGKMGYGTPATVVGTENNTLAISFIKQKTPEPSFGLDAAKIEHDTIIYHSAYETARILHLKPYILSKITSSYMIFDGQKKVNIGLSLKFEGKSIKTLGYTRKTGNQWEYSDIAINLIRDYMHSFPDLFKAVIEYSGSNIPQAKAFFPRVSGDKLSEMLRNIKDYLLNKRMNLTQVSLSSDSLSKLSIAKIEKQIIRYNETPQPTSAFQIKNIPRYAVLNPSMPVLKLKHQQFRLGDRVMYILNSGKVALFSKGTVVGYRSSETSVSVHVVFDSPVLSGNTFDGRLATQRGLSIDSSSLLNLTLRHYSYPPVMNDTKASTSKTMNKFKHNLSKVGREISGPKVAALRTNGISGHEKPSNQYKTKTDNKTESSKHANLKKESKQELLTIINKNSEKPKMSSKVSSNNGNFADLTTSVNSNKGNAKNLLNTLFNNALNLGNDQSVTQQSFPNAFSGVPFPPINGNPFSNMQFPPMPMYPYMAVPANNMPAVPYPSGIIPVSNGGFPTPVNIPTGPAAVRSVAKEIPKPTHKASIRIDAAGSEAVLNAIKGSTKSAPGSNKQQKKPRQKGKKKFDNSKVTDTAPATASN
ncbi:hypothetical protein CANINC_003636 [Pichia inconspicua]|uniref:5'-3' exoribonuclease 1 n=1 Tax=Pichia inconspicua TaxID=52247 RepID=A0A4T0WY60_9ASCO|nr:hypothetical protein CANINC_003636 [[Candida] inconspicua]